LEEERGKRKIVAKIEVKSNDEGKGSQKKGMNLEVEKNKLSYGD